jgi:hypothetical protein
MQGRNAVHHNVRLHRQIWQIKKTKIYYIYVNPRPFQWGRNNEIFSFKIEELSYVLTRIVECPRWMFSFIWDINLQHKGFYLHLACVLSDVTSKMCFVARSCLRPFSFNFCLIWAERKAKDLKSNLGWLDSWVSLQKLVKFLNDYRHCCKAFPVPVA